MKSRRYIVSLFAVMAAMLLAVGPFLARPGLAQAEPTGFSDVVLSVYPEYDNLGGIRPSLLVMLEGQIEGATAPATVRFLVPKNAVMYSAGSGPRSTYQGGPPNRKASGIAGWDEISYELKTNSFVIEYYVPIPADADKVFSSAFIPLYPVAGLTAIVQEPLKSSNFSVETESIYSNQQVYPDSKGFKYHEYRYDGIDANQEVGFSLSYTRTETNPSLQTKDSAGAGILVLAALAGIAVIGFVVYMLRRKPTYDRRSSRRAVARSQGKGSPARPAARTAAGREAPPASGRFCTECGARMDNVARFCKECGAKQRTGK